MKKREKEKTEKNTKKQKRTCILSHPSLLNSFNYFFSFLLLFTITLRATPVSNENKTDNTALLIKSLISRMKEKLEVDDDNFPSLIKETETCLAQQTDTATVALLHSMVAEMYSQYYQINKRKTDRRTPVQGFVPDDIREWTSNLFTARIEEELAASLEPRQLLSETKTAAFKDIMSVGEDTAFLRPTLYEFLAFRAIDILPSDKVYRDLIAYYEQKNDTKSLLPVLLAYGQYQYRNSYSFGENVKYETFVDSLINVYKDKPCVVEAIQAKLEVLQNKSYKPETTDSIRTLQYQLCKDAIARYPDYERIGLITNWLAEMEKTVLEIQSSNTVYPGKNLELTIRYTNLSRLTVAVYRSKKTIEETFSHIYNYNSSAKKDISGELVKEVSFPLTLKNIYTSVDSSIAIRMDQPGLYEYVVTSPDKEIRINNLFSVTRLAITSRNAPSGIAELLVTDYQTGKPVNGATVSYYRNERNALVMLGTVKTGKDGLAALPERDDIRACRTCIAGDTSAFMTSVYTGRRGSGDNPVNTEVWLLTDRGLYRPGQTVFFKGIAYTNEKDNPQVVTGKRLDVTLRDANYQEVATKSFTTNEYGSFTGEFTLPGRTLTGQFTLVSPNGSASIQVEEYKRPTFTIELDKLKDEIAFGDEATIRGKVQTFSGVPLQQADISYRIIRRPFWFRMYYDDWGEEEQVARGTAAINSDGTFSFTFRPEKSDNSFPLSFQSYDVKVTVTDSKSEIQEAQSVFSVGDRSIILSTDLKKQMEKESAVVKIHAVTLNGEETPAEGMYRIVTLDDTKEVAQGTFSTDIKLGKETFGQLPSGRLRLHLTARDNKGRTIDYAGDFILYGKQDKRPPVFTHTWLLAEKTDCLPGEEATIVFGTSDKEAYVLYELFTSNKNVARERIVLSNENRTFRIPFLESYADGVIASFTFVKEGKLYTQQMPIQKRLPNKNLTIRPETFRDHLLPGSRESWKFRIQNADSTAVLAEVLTGMYDASLDKIRPFAWYFAPATYRSLYYGRFAEGEGFRTRRGYALQPVKTRDVSSPVYTSLDWQGVLDFGVAYLKRNAGGVMATAAPMMRSSVSKAAPLQETASLQDDAFSQDTATDTEESILSGIREPASVPVLRTNFNETAFFFPMLTTDKEGDVFINFTIPESNTAWKLQALAHTKDLKSGLFAREVITQKPLMALPNLPRFVREGDEVSLSAQIMNVSDQVAEGMARLELFDPVTDEPVVCLTKAQKSFSIQTKGMETVSWTITIPLKQDLLGVRIIADSETGSDGEQHILPVLSNELLVTESAPFYLPKEGEQRMYVPTGKPSDTRRPYAMTLEYSDNPVWYAVQALPTVSQPDNDNVISWFAAYYSNTVAASIAQSNPRIKKIIELWTAQGETAATLVSNLEKNEELKDVLLQETPWILDARSETEQKQRLSLLFDINRANNLRDAALKVLVEQQHESGGWGWFNEFYPNRSITLFILNGLSQLTHLSAVQYGPQEKAMQMKALDYLDKAILRDYEALTKTKPAPDSYIPTAGQINYLYVRSLYRDIPEWGDAREAIRFFTTQAEKQWQKTSLYEKGQIALLLHRNGKKEVAETILAWLRKTATTSREQGMYWANNKRENNFFHSPIDVHSLLMTAFEETGTDTDEINRMKQWLLNRKQTQKWETVPSTINAVYSLLATGTDWLTEGNNSVIKWGDKTFDAASGETATGYIKEVAREKDITTALHTVVIQKKGKAPAWGAIYNQYFEAIDKIEKQTGALSVEKKLFIETNSGTQRQITPLTPDRPLRTGDKVVVRLTIRTDCEMEYVSLKDTRPGCFEPASQRSGYQFMDGLLYYHAPKDASEHFYFDWLPTGMYVVEYAAFVSRTGTYGGGIATIQCQYAPEFISHTEGSTLVVSE